jgi:uncharacterized membrane protein YedE/YeeE
MQEPLINIGDGIVIAGYLFAGLGIRLAGTCEVDMWARVVPFEAVTK